MNCQITVALIGVISGLIGLWAGNRLAWGRDDRNSRAKFRGVIFGFRAMAGRADDYNFPAWFAGMQAKVEEQCGFVESAIGWRFRRRFTDARNECAKPQTQNDLADPRSPQVPTNTIAIGLDYLPPLTYQRGRIRAVEILDGLLDACK
jgi:hypothetical protein